MRTMTYQQARNDAGYLREYTAAHYGAVLTHGGDGRVYEAGRGLIKRLARMTGLSYGEVLEAIREDYEAMYA